MHDAKMRQVPTLFVRFEDLNNNPEPELRNIMRFMTGLKDLDGTNAERRVKEVMAKGHAAAQTYALKETTKRVNSQAIHYTQA